MMHARRSLLPLLAASALLAPPAFAQDGAAPAEAPAAPAPAVALPDAKEIVAKAIDAIGGKDAWMALTSIDMKGTMEIPAAKLKGPMRTVIGAPARMVTSMEIAGLGVFRSGYDGKTGWSMDKMSGPRLLAGKELEMLAREADLFKELDISQRFDSVETVGEGKFGGFDCWKVLGKRGEDVTTLWYEKDTYLTRGIEMTVTTQMGKIPVKTVMSEYREIDGIRLPVRSEATQMGQKMVSTFSEIVLNKATDADFEVPAEVKALLEPEPAEEGDEAPAAAPAAPAAPVDPNASTPTSHPAPADPKR